MTAIAAQAGMVAALHRDLGGRARVLELRVPERKIPLGKGNATA